MYLNQVVFKKVVSGPSSPAQRPNWWRKSCQLGLFVSIFSVSLYRPSSQDPALGEYTRRARAQKIQERTTPPPLDCPTIVTATPRSWKAGLYRAFCHLLVAPSLPLPHARAHYFSPPCPVQVPTPLTSSGLSSHRSLALQAGPFPSLILLGPHLLWGDKLNYAKYWEGQCASVFKAL